MPNLKTALAAILVLFFASCERIRDDLSDCGVWLEFVFDHNMEYTDSFDTQIRTVDVYVFNETGKFVGTRHASIDELRGRKRMLLDNLRFGDYRVLTVGNLDSEHFRVNLSNIEQAELALVHDGVVSCGFDHLFVGLPVEVKYNADRSVYRVPLIRQTNKFSITLQTTTPKPATTRAEPVHTVDIVAPEAGRYDHRNKPTDRSKVTYRPHSLRVEDDRTAAKIHTMRLLEEEQDGYRIAVRNVGDGSEIWSADLLPLLAATKPARRPDNTDLPCAEYYDREGNWNIVIIHRGGLPDSLSGDGFVALRIIVNGWVVWQNGMGV